MITSNQSIHTNIKLLLEPLDINEQVEILANLFIDLGVRHLPIQSSPQEITKHDIIKIILDDVKTCGDTIPNSLVRQLLSWLEDIDLKKKKI